MCLLTLSVGNTLDGSLEECLTRLTRGHPVVEARGYVAANQAQPLRATIVLIL